MRTLLWGMLLATGCGLDLALDLTSEGTDVTATAFGNGTTEVTICAGPRGLLSCNDDVGFTVTMDDQMVTGDALQHLLFGGRTAYLRGERPGAEIVVTRAGDGAKMSVELPAPFRVVAPLDGATVSRRQGFTLRLDPSSDLAGAVRWIATATCGETITSSSGDGTTLRGGSLPEMTGASCELELLVERSREGHVGRGFADDSHIRGVQRRAVVLQLTP